ncbi:DinB family protein [Sediminibacillus terrae]|uniref:DinB family protein n=1 Tax=Sediminibacillus terrae TaxID=1562106 RepID=UPI001296DE6E|nr:DinB family protein [Sediminibacillus terrae]
MKKLFQYNWQVRDDWFTWCEHVPEEELLKNRAGGVGSILYTLFHIIEVEHSWLILDLKGDPEREKLSFEKYDSLKKVRELSERLHREVEPFVDQWTSEMEARLFIEKDADGNTVSFKHGEIIRHVIAHEIHHIGQLSIWARELGRQPVTANLIRRGLFAD